MGKYESEQMKDQVRKIYEVIIKFDPILYLHHIKNDKEKVKSFLREYPSLYVEYPTEKRFLANMFPEEEENFYIN